MMKAYKCVCCGMLFCDPDSIEDVSGREVLVSPCCKDDYDYVEEQENVYDGDIDFRYRQAIEMERIYGI